MHLLLYALYSLVVAAVYGLFAFFVIYRGLSGQVMLYAYFWNITFIVAFLLLDKLATETLLSKELVITKKNCLIAGTIHMFSFISFKTTLYLFYSFILIVSRVSILEPSLVNYDFQRFVFSIEYCLILVVAFDKFSEYLQKDDKRIQRIEKKFDACERNEEEVSA